MAKKKEDKVIDFFTGKPLDEMERMIEAELDDIDPEDLEDDFYGTDLDEEKWDTYRRICDSLKSVMSKESKIEEIKYLNNPCHTDDSATVTIKAPFLWGTFDKRLKDAIGQAMLECDGVTITCLEDKKIRITFSVSDIWKTNNS